MAASLDIPHPYLKIIIMNTNGPSDGKGSAERRKKVISDIVKKHEPDMVMFQEFRWSGISGSTWKQAPIPENFEYTKNGDSGLLFDKNNLMMSTPQFSEMLRLQEEMIRKGELPQSFDPMPRMCVRFIETKGVPIMRFFAISWHGPYSEFEESERMEELGNLLKFIKQYAENKQMSVLLAGDFNLEIRVAKNIVRTPFTIYEYTALERREGNIIDYFIASDGLKLSTIVAIDIEKETSAVDPFKVLNHDPIKASLTKVADKKEKSSGILTGNKKEKNSKDVVSISDGVPKVRDSPEGSLEKK